MSNSFPAYSNSNKKEDWEKFLKEAHNVKKESLLENSDNTNKFESIPENNSVLLEDISIFVPLKLENGVKIAINDLKKYFEELTGKTVLIQSYNLENNNFTFQEEIKSKNIIVIGNPKNENRNINVEDEENFSISAKPYKIKDKSVNFIYLESNNFISQQYSIYHLMELTGKRFFSYKQDFTPNIKKAKLPANNFLVNFKTNKKMKLRGFSPHLYHPIPLSIAFHEPSDKHFEMIKEYLDWLVQNKQNYVILPMLELDKQNKYLPFRDENKPKFKEWLPFANKIVNYAHQRGIKISIKLAFANFVSTNSFAINPFKAVSASIDLDNKWAEIEKLDSKNHLKEKLTIEYNQLLKKYSKEDFKDIKKLVDNFMKVSWDEITWHIGTSEFSPTNDDLTIEWMNDTYKYLKENYPKVEMSVRSHVPPKPFSKKYNTPYFELIKFADIGINNLVHTVQAYSLIDKAPVYGTENFEHKLKYLFFSDPKRKNIYYPENSYWVTYDVDVPLFLPVYMLNRKQDIDIVKKIDHLYGHVTFTTAWEWGYWFNDYISAKMQISPEKTLNELLSESFMVFDKAQEPMVKIFQKLMLSQQEFLLDKNLHKYMKGVSWLTDFGITLKNSPLVNSFLEGTNSTPERLKPEVVSNWNKKQLDTFINTDLKDMELMMGKFNDFSKDLNILENLIPNESKSFYLEFCDALKINYLRSKQIYYSWKAIVLLREGKLERNNELKKEAKKYLFRSKSALQEAMLVIKNREQFYKDLPEYTYRKLESPTIWNDRYLTSVHNFTYWELTYDEIKNIFEKDDFINIRN